MRSHLLLICLLSCLAACGGRTGSSHAPDTGYAGDDDAGDASVPSAPLPVDAGCDGGCASDPDDAGGTDGGQEEPLPDAGGMDGGQEEPLPDAGGMDGGQEEPLPDAGGMDGGQEEPLPVDALEAALRTGDPSALTDAAEIALRAQQFAQTLETAQSERLTRLAGGVSTEYTPAGSSQWVLPANAELSQPWIVGDRGRVLASLSQAEGGRSAGYGEHILWQFRNNTNLAHIPAFKRLMGWLVWGDAMEQPLPVPLIVGWAGLDRTDREAGMARAGISLNNLDCDILADSLCGAQAHVLIVGSGVAPGSGLADTIRAYLRAGKPVLYLHGAGWQDSESGRTMLDAMGLVLGPYGGNFWDQDAVAAGRTPAQNTARTSQFAALLPLIGKLAQGGFRTNYDWSQCTEFVSSINCDDVPGLRSELLDPIATLGAQLDTLNRQGRELFATPNQTLPRLLALWADVARRGIHYPLDKQAHPAEFQRALAADGWVAYVRRVGGAQPDLGSFMSERVQRIDWSDTEETLTLDLASDSGFTALGRFALPGKPLVVEVLDAGGAKLALRLNTQRTGSTRLWNPMEYDRPRFLASPDMALQPHVPLTVVTPYGGTLQLQFSQATPGTTITLKVRGVVKHPFLDLTRSGSTRDFLLALTDDRFDWAEIKSAATEIHTRVDMMRQVIHDDYANDLDRYLSELRILFIEDAYRLAGFPVVGASLPPAVQSFCAAEQWDCTSPGVHRLPATQHINVDRYAHCGGGCGGNPYDQSWPLMPRGWGESHELGHNLQVEHLKVYGGRSGEVSNQIFPLHKNWRLLRELGVNESHDRVGYRAAFNLLVQGRQQADKVEGVYQRLWVPSGIYDMNGERMAFFTQWSHYWQERTGVADQAWDVYTLLHLHERLFRNGDWATYRQRLGFSRFSTRPSLEGNDYLVIALSWITKRDQRPMFELWGVRYGSEASAQVAAYGFSAQPQVFYANTASNDYTTVRRVDMNVTYPVWPF
ncbi:ImpA family metalloprotease [Archangium violaceum]|uniref:ImpA family metalloprotease n=1 Tax=Archangium violaceum TaxID=83451 RepID=UPI002B31933B|nr:ImpA family metalloprotease [Archangium gephyra]